MKRRDIIKSLALLPIAGSVQSMLAACQQDSSSQHKTFFMDGHVHLISRQLFQGGDIGQRYSDGHVDLPRIREGELSAVFFSLHTSEDYLPGHYEVKNTFRVIELALDQIEKNKNVIELALTATDIEQINRRGKIAAFLDLEGSFDFYGDINLLRAMYRLGLRSIMLSAHNATNAFADTCCDEKKWGGLTAHGKELVAEMNRLGMVINIAHASDEVILQAVDISRHPLIYSHGGFRGYVDQPRNITDEGANALAAKGGVIGLQFGPGFNKPRSIKNGETPKVVHGSPTPTTSASMTIEEADQAAAKRSPYLFSGIPKPLSPSVIAAGWTTEDFVKAIDYGVRLVGEDHVALGSDFDGGPTPPSPMKDISDYPEIAKAMQRFGYSEKRIAKIMGLNWLRVIREVTEG